VPLTSPLIVEAKVHGMWRLRLVRCVGWLLPRRALLRVARWAVERVTVDVRSGNAQWRTLPGEFRVEELAG
jgi:hypothetical protein